MNPFWGVFLLIKTWFCVKNADNWIFRHGLPVVFFLGMFCKLQNIRWQINIRAEISNRGPWSKSLEPSNSYGTHLIQSYKNGTPLIRNSTSQKFHSAAMAFHNYIIGFLKYKQFNTLLVESTPAIGHKIIIRIALCSGKNLTLKLNDHESESHNKFKNYC